MKNIKLTKQEESGVYELMCGCLFDKKNQPIVGFMGISPDGYVGLIKLFERMNKTKPKTDYKILLFKLVERDYLLKKLKE